MRTPIVFWSLIRKSRVVGNSPPNKHKPCLFFFPPNKYFHLHCTASLPGITDLGRDGGRTPIFFGSFWFVGPGWWETTAPPPPFRTTDLSDGVGESLPLLRPLLEMLLPPAVVLPGPRAGRDPVATNPTSPSPVRGKKCPPWLCCATRGPARDTYAPHVIATNHTPPPCGSQKNTHAQQTRGMTMAMTNPSRSSTSFVTWDNLNTVVARMDEQRGGEGSPICLNCAVQRSGEGCPFLNGGLIERDG